jgi:hypothetical protein
MSGTVGLSGQRPVASASSDVEQSCQPPVEDFLFHGTAQSMKKSSVASQPAIHAASVPGDGHESYEDDAEFCADTDVEENIIGLSESVTAPRLSQAARTVAPSVAETLAAAAQQAALNGSPWLGDGGNSD